ncbi:MAG: adenylyl-sulfate kinase [Candidatus Cryptobacteroides sp.]
MTENIFPIKDIMESRTDKETVLGQKGVTIWFTGLSGSGKSTVAIALESLLSSNGYLCRILDGDNIRTGLNSNLGFSEADRNENIRRIAEVCKLFTETGIITIAAFVSPTNDLRRMARDIVGKDDFVEIYMSTPLEECERRDVKGLYARARKGEVKNFTGISAPFDIPEEPTLSIDTTNSRPEECAQLIFNEIAGRISFGDKQDKYEENYI